MKHPAFRPPSPSEQQVLEQLHVRLLQPPEQARFEQLITEKHYLGNCHLVGNRLGYVAEHQGQWLALLTWSAAAYHLQGREEWIGWSSEQLRRRRALLVNNSRFLILAEQFPNLGSRVMRLCLERLSGDWQEAFGHPLLVAESFVDSQLFRGTVYKASGWTLLGETQGFGRAAQDYYLAHERPKQLWVRELGAGARPQLRAAQLPPALARVEEQTAPGCPFASGELRSLVELFEGVSDWRARKGRKYPLAGMLTLIAAAALCGVSAGQRDLAAFAAGLSQAQRRALRFRYDRRAGRYDAPQETCFFQVLNKVNPPQLQQALLAFLDRVLGPVKASDDLFALDGKELRHARGTEIVSAFSVRGQRWLGSVLVHKGSNEIPAARELIESLPLENKTAVLDALHTQAETARQIVFEKGGHYLLTLKGNQSGLRQTVQQLFAATDAASARTDRAFFPSPGRDR